MKITAAVVAACLQLAGAALVPPVKVSYDGYKVFRVAVGDDVAHINDVVAKYGLKTWKGAPRANAMADIVVPPHQLDSFRADIGDRETITMHEDLGASIAEESSTFGTYAAGSANSSWFNAYHAYSDHLQFLRDLVAAHPSNAEIATSGSSLQGNAITGIHFWGSAGKGKKPAVVLHGTVHAREWISTMVVEYFAYTLLTGYNSTAEIKSFIDKYDFYVFPVVNPDGFLYTQANDRLWRKNRQTTSGSTCLGHDINRNWPYQWSVPGGASTNPCAEDFKGAAQGDAPETKALSTFLKNVKSAQGLKLFIDYHSYSQLFMTRMHYSCLIKFPVIALLTFLAAYGYSCTAVTAKNTELQSLAKGVVAAIKAVHGTSFQYGPICTTIYQATGSSVDYTNDVVGSDYTFTSELRDTGNYGFVLPANQIVPSGEEAYAGFRYLLLNMK